MTLTRHTQVGTTQLKEIFSAEVVSVLSCSAYVHAQNTGMVVELLC